MIKVCGYTLKEELCRSNDSILYRGERDKDNEPVLVKTYNTIGNKSSCIEKLKQELLNLSNHRIEGFLSLYGVGSYSDGIVLVFQDFKGIPIVEYFQKYHWGIIQFLDVAIQFIEILINIQKSNIIHKVRSPENILYDHESGRIKIIDSGISHFLTKEDDYLSNPDLLIKTLPYTSPEEHSLLHMTPNFSSDLYLAGVLFYELITGEKPFQRESPIEIINSNLTENAPSIFELAPEVPSIVGKIILKMIENQQEERYRTGKGLIFDLERCREEYINSGKISDFTLGSRDLVDKIFLPSKIFGRKNEIDIIKKEYKKVQNGDFRTLLISGQPGIGKTRLVEELQGFFIEKGSYYIDWKCCKDRNDLSYDMIMQAFAKFIRRLLSEDEEEVERCRERIIDAVGINGTLIIEKIPDLEKLIGVQPDVEPLPPTRAKNRFKDIFNSFVGSLPSKEHPLVIFIDDLQWCDLSSFMFISDMLASNEEKKYIYLLGAYQNNKLEANHPLKNLIMRAKESEWPVDIIRLEPLNADDCHRMISNMTGSNNTELKPLIKFISDVSLGNPNLIVDVLLSLQKEGILCLNDENQWNWDIRSIHKIDLPEDIIGPFLSRIETLPANTRDLLKLCACMGYQFSIVDFCEAVDMEKSVVFADLSPAVEIGVLIIDENSISFIHKKLHQAIRQNIPKDEFKKINRRIGNKLLSIIPRGVNPEGVDNLFTIVDHLNDGINKNLNRISVFKLARLNYYAGNRALKYFNFEISNKYFRQSVRLLSDDYWDSYYEFRFSSYINLARSEMAIGNHKESLALLDILLERSINDLDKIECLVVQSANLLSIGEYYIAIETLNKGLEYFNNSIPIDAESVRIKIDEYAGTIDDYSIDPFEIINKETSFSRRDLILFSLYNNLIPAYYSIGQVDKFFLAALQSVKLCLNTGIHYKAIYPFSVYLAFLLEKGNFHKAFRYEDLIIHLCRKYPDSSGQTRGLSSIVWLCLHWRKSPAEVYDYCLESIESGKRSGDRYHTGLSYCAALWSCIYQAKDLKMIEEQMFKCDKFAERYDQSISKDVSRGIKAALVEPMKVDGKMISMKKNIDIWLLTEDFIKLGNYYILAGMTQYYLGNYQKANEYLNQGEYYLPGHTGNILNRIWHIFFMLNSLRMTGMDLTDEKKDAVLTKIRTSLDKVKFWANFGPALNPYLALIYAEQKRIFGNFSEARNLYLDAIDIASEHEYVLLKGHILECLGELLFENRNEQAEFYIKKASEIYMKCNADQKYHLLRNRFTKFFQTVDDKKDDKDDLNYHISYNKPFETVYNKQSYKVNFNSFIEISAQFFIEIFGATHGYFIVEENSSLVILFQWIKKKKFELIVKKESLSNSIGLSKAIVRYVWRTKKSFFLDNAIEEGPFVHDRDVQQFKLRSVICQPIFNQEKLAGIIYMQNNHSSSMFTDNLRKFLEIIASQLVISLETGIKVDDYKDIIKDLEETREKLMVAEPLSMIGQLSGSISHELRNPLGVIDSSVYYLIKKLRDTDDPKIIQHLDRIREHVKRSTAIIESLQKLMQMEEPTKKSIDLSVLLDDAISASQVPESIEVSTKLANSNIYIFGDYEQLRMTFTNIIKNAIEAMEGKGRLIIQADLEDGRFVKLFFKDTGAGISSNNINRVFQPLFSTKPRGMGFGLSICQRIVEMHKGTIAVESDSNKGGSIFTVQLPFNYQALN